MTDLLSEKNFLKNKSLFKMIYVMNTLFFSVHFLQYVSYVLIVPLFFWGCGLIICGIAKGRIKKVFLWKYFAAFLCLGVVSNILSIIGGYASPLGIVLGILMLIVTAQFMFLFFGGENGDTQTARLEVYHICKILFYAISVLNIIGLALLFIFHQLIEVFGQRLIIYDNRFTGIIINPNMDGFNCFICILSGFVLINSAFCRKIGKKPLRLYVAVPLMIIAYFSLMLTASRGAVLILTVFLAVAVLLYTVFLIKNKRLYKRIACLIAAVAFTVLTPISFYTGVFSKFTSSIISKDSINIGSSIKKDAADYHDELHTESGEITFEHITGRKDGSGRMGLYKKSFDLFLQKPIFGWGNGNVLLMGKKVKNTIDNFLLSFGDQMFEAHNAYLTILSTGGITSFAVFAFCGFMIILTLLKGTLKSFKNGGGILAVLTAFTVAYCAYAMVEPTMVYYPAFVVAVFWFFIGNAVTIAKKQIKDKNS